MAPIVTPPTVLPWYMKGGATIFTRGEVSRRARMLLESDDYQTSLLERIKDKSLPAAVEVMLWHYGYGKPAENVNLNVTSDLTSMTTSDLRARAQVALDALQEAEAIEQALDAAVTKVA